MDYPFLKEVDLIKRIQGGDTEAFDEIMRRDSEYILGWINARTTNPSEVEDLFQSTMIKCWNKIGRFRGDSAFRTWACAVARNLFIDDWRKKQRRREESLEAINDEGQEKVLQGIIEPDFLKKFKDEELGVFLEMVMKDLSQVQNNALRHFALDELSYQEISKIEKCSVGTVMSRLYYARKRAQSLVRSHKNNKLYCDND